jgi:SAM-dependent methyltransferase
VIGAALRRLLMEPRVRDLDLDSPESAVAHRAVLQEKTMLRELFESFYRDFRAMDQRYFGSATGRRLEIGSGASFMAQIFPDVITSDVKRLPFVDCVARAEQLPFPASSLRAVYAINVFHHFPQPRAFLRELSRVLSPGGGAVLIEPYYGPAARLLFKSLHQTEGFDPAGPWDTPAQSGPMSNANQALSYIVFKRDRRIFEQEFPGLILEVDRPHTHLLYLLSGGVNFRQLVPDGLTPLIKLAERVLAPLNPLLALQHTIVLRKRSP